MSVFDVAIGGEPPDHLTPVGILFPSTVQSSPYVDAVLASIINVMVRDCPLASVVPSGSAVLNAQVLIAEFAVVVSPQIVFAAAVITVKVLELNENPVAILLNVFSITRPPRTAAPSVSSAG